MPTKDKLITYETQPGLLDYTTHPMKFCIQCGKTVAIFSNSDRELCPDCDKRKAVNEDRPAAAKNDSADLLAATLSIKDGKIFLESREGMLLWSGTGGQPHTLKTILDRASRILAIRQRRS